MFGRKDKLATRSVVASVKQQTAEAEALARIAGQHRLMDPRTNPAVRALADDLRDERQRQMLRAEDARVQRRLRVADARAAEAERALEALALARQASNPARSVLALHQGRRRYMRVSLVASIALAAGSAMGVEAAAQHLHAPTGSGYIAEIGLTGLATLAITYRAHLAEHRGTLPRGGWQSRVLWALMTVPLLVSVACNAATLNVIGAACAIGAAAFSVLSCVIADRSAAAMQDRAAEVSAQDEAELRSVAMGEDLFTIQAEEELTEAEREAEALEAEFAAGLPAVEAPTRPELFSDEALAAWIDGGDPPAGEVTSAPPAPDADGPQGAAKALPASPEASMRTRGRIDGDQRDGGVGGVEVPPGVESAVAARRAQGEQTRARIAAYMDAHPGATAAEIAAALDLSKDTVKRHRRQIRQEAE